MPLRLFPAPVLPLPDFIHRHFYRHFDTIHSGKPGDRIQATGYSSPTNSLPVKQSAKLRLNIQLKNTSGLRELSQHVIYLLSKVSK